MDARSWSLLGYQLLQGGPQFHSDHDIEQVQESHVDRCIATDRLGDLAEEVTQPVKCKRAE